MEVKRTNTIQTFDDANLTIEEIAAQRAEEIADLQAIPEFMRKKGIFAKKLSSISSRNSNNNKKPSPSIQSVELHPTTSVTSKDESDKIHNLYPTTSVGGDSLISVETNQPHTRHHAHLHTTSNKDSKDNSKIVNTSSNLDSIVSDNNKSSDQISSETAGSTTWAAIDTLDDVRKLAKETKDIDYFHEDQEKSLNQMRKNHIKLLKLMKERNSKLEKVEPVEDLFVDARIDPSKSDSEDATTSSSINTRKKYGKNSRAFVELIPEPISPLDNYTTDENKKKPIYVSDYLENLSDVEWITSRECQYIEQMERIIKDTDAA